MGCSHSLSALISYFYNPHTPSGMPNNRNTPISINGDTDDTIPLTSSKAKNNSRDLINHNEKNFSRIIPLLEERDPSSTFANVNDNRRFSTVSNKSRSSSSSVISLEDGISNSIKENEFLPQDQNSDLNQNQPQNNNLNLADNDNANITHMSSHHSADINLLYNKGDLLMSTEDEGGISGEMDSSFDDT